MQYLYFDIECATCKGGKGKICTFGYVLVDENFNIITSEDIIINPGIKRKEYDWYVVKNILAYPVSEIEKHPNFKENYSTIKNLLTNPNHITLGFDVYNDLKYINDECLRCREDEIKIKSYDVQDFYKQFSGNKNSVSLFKLAKELDIDTSDLKEHKSVDDAILTMRVAKIICEKMDTKIFTLFELCDKSIVESNKKPNPEKVFAKKLKKLEDKYPDRKNWEVICLSNTIKPTSIQGRLNLIKQIFKHNYNYTNSTSNCNYFVTGSDNENLFCDKNNEEINKNIKKITIGDLSKMLKTEVDENGECAEEKIIDKNSPIYLAFQKTCKDNGITFEDWLKSLK